MASFNKVILLGNLTRDPEVRYTPKGSAVCDLGIAINRQYTLDSGEKREEVTYVDVVLWSRLAEIAGEYLKKGRPIFYRGPSSNWTLGRQTKRTKAEQAARDRRNDAIAWRSSSRRQAVAQRKAPKARENRVRVNLLRRRKPAPQPSRTTTNSVLIRNAL